MRVLFNGSLCSATITTAETDTIATTKVLREAPAMVEAIAICSGTVGTSIDAYVQTTGDLNLASTSWVDVMRFSFTTSAQPIVKQLKLSAGTDSLTATSLTGIGAHSISADVALPAMSTAWRVVYTSVGTYTGGSLSINFFAVG